MIVAGEIERAPLMVSVGVMVAEALLASVTLIVTVALKVAPGIAIVVWLAVTAPRPFLRTRMPSRPLKKNE